MKGIAMKNKFRDLPGILLVCLALIIGWLTVMENSVIHGIFYALILVSATLVIIYAFCNKCVIKNEYCFFYLPGKLTKIFPDRKSVNYTTTDYLAIVIALFSQIVYPQWWLWQDKLLFAIFWILILTGATQIRMFICPVCGNTNCTLCPKYHSNEIFRTGA